MKLTLNVDSVLVLLLRNWDDDDLHGNGVLHGRVFREVDGRGLDGVRLVDLLLRGVRRRQENDSIAGGVVVDLHACFATQRAVVERSTWVGKRARRSLWVA